MRFREYNNLKSVIVSVNSQEELSEQIEKIASEHNIIDLQFSTDYITPSLGSAYTKYHALLLVETTSEVYNK